MKKPSGGYVLLASLAFTCAVIAFAGSLLRLVSDIDTNVVTWHTFTQVAVGVVLFTIIGATVAVIFVQYIIDYMAWRTEDPKAK